MVSHHITNTSENLFVSYSQILSNLLKHDNSPSTIESLGLLYVNGCEASLSIKLDINRTRKWQKRVIHWMNSVLCRTSPTFPYLYSLAEQTNFPSWCTPLLLGHPVYMYHGNQMWLYPYNKAPALQDNSRTHCLASRGRGILLLQSIFNKTCQ